MAINDVTSTSRHSVKLIDKTAASFPEAGAVVPGEIEAFHYRNPTAQNH